MTVEISPPQLMPAWMAVTAVVILLLAVAGLLWSLLSHRVRDGFISDIPMAPGERRRWMRLIERAAKKYDAGQIDLRVLHLELASALRGFGSERSGEDLTTATVTEIMDMSASTESEDVETRLKRARTAAQPLDANPLGHVGELLAIWEQPSFDRDSDAVAARAIEHARQVVSRW
ncbi:MULTISPECIES: alpha-amylase [Actinomyces]|uniref:alpha-amylase n=1 Tax=Actinomyces TaxID=1654 RepID=UPI00158B3D47|nr:MULTISPECIES: alpha-amylase [Actinomyces]